MSKVNDRVAYLKGLAEGLKLSEDKDSEKVLLRMLDVLEEMAKEITALRDDLNNLDDYMQSIDDDLADMEEDIYGSEDDEDDEDDDEEDDDDGVMEYTCPHCGVDVTFDADGFDFSEDNLCPNCGKPLFPETEDDDN